jgi:hypothetical protein
VGHSAAAPYYAYKNEYQAARGQWAFYYNGVPEEVPRLASGPLLRCVNINVLYKLPVLKSADDIFV